ncbi:hypothetical protein PspTeo4_43872 [Pseudomonas sp. Teo4]|nr:hypothetical protein [Pseudomonas sp. Teo4]
MEIRLLHGAASAPYIDDLARLRLTVFREFPYLYDGDMEYEADYLGTYMRSGRSLVVLALDDGKVVGASTGLPLVDVASEFQQPFLAQGRDPASVYYFGESVVLPAYRGAAWVCASSSNVNPTHINWPSSTTARSVRSSGLACIRDGQRTTSHCMVSGVTEGSCMIPRCAPRTPGVTWTSRRSPPS